METNSHTNKYVFDPESAEEMVRLINLDRMVTKNMGGCFSGITDTTGIKNVLDIACGPGGWVLDVAYTYPQMDVSGVDISHNMIAYANMRARSQGLNNASFGVMDVSGPLDFDDGCFDLVNVRFLFSTLQNTFWEHLIAECLRLLRPGGLLRMTESMGHITTSLGFTRLGNIFYKSLWLDGKGFSPDGSMLAVATVLPHLVRKAGCEDVHIIPYMQDYSIDTPAWADGYRNIEIMGLGFKVQALRHGLATQEEVDAWYQDMLVEMRSDDFCATQHYATVMGKKPR